VKRRDRCHGNDLLLADSLSEVTLSRKEVTEKWKEPTRSFSEVTDDLPEASSSSKKASSRIPELAFPLKEPAPRIPEPAFSLKEPSSRIPEPIFSLKEPGPRIPELASSLKEPSTHRKARAPSRILPAMSAYTSFDPEAERRRLRVQAEVLEPLGERALAQLGDLRGKRALDVACGAMGMLPALSRRVGPQGSVVGTDTSDAMLEQARATCAGLHLGNVTLVKDDAYATALPPASFDVVHVRFLLAPVGRDEVLLPQLERLARPDGWIVLEEPIAAPWHVGPGGEAHDALLAIVQRTFVRHMGGFEAGRRLFDHARTRGWRDIGYDAQTFAMPPGHPLLRLPVMFATSLRAVILRDTPEAELDAAIAAAEELYARPATHGTGFTVIQVWGHPPA
jgi:SAM-dependent methyltransferase